MIAILKHIDIEGPGIFANFLSQAGFDMQTYELYREKTLPLPKRLSGILVMGGPMNVYEVDKYPFLANEEEFLRKAIEKGIPILGICLGAQILAKIAGAKVYKSPKKEIGWHDVSLTSQGKSDPLFEGLGRKSSVFQWHEDTFDIPKNAVHIARGVKVANQAFCFRDCVWGLQYHPEITSRLIRSLVKKADDSVDLQKMMHGYFSNQETYLKQAKKMSFNFAKIIKGKKKL